METTKSSQDIQTHKSMATKLLNLTARFSELGTNLQMPKGEEIK